jgi:hypothetical protein
MRDLQVFLNWYLSPRTRMKRGLFNVVFFLAFIPVLYVKFMDMTESTSQKADQYAPMMSMLKSGLSGEQNLDATDIQGILKRSEQTRENTRDLMEVFDFQSFQNPNLEEPTSKSKKKTGLGEILNFLIYLGLIPIVMMRLRDLGKWENSCYIYTGLVYGGIALDSLKSLLGMSFPLWLTSAAGILSFILISWLCMGNTKIRPKDIHKEDNYLPGDRPDDPY